MVAPLCMRYSICLKDNGSTPLQRVPGLAGLHCTAAVSGTQDVRQLWAVWLLIGVACRGSCLLHIEGLL